MKRRRSCIPLCAAMAVVVAPAWAQSTSNERFALEEIIVTAQKREESLQNVPVAVSVIGGSQLVDLGIEDFAAVADYVPSLSVTNAANITVISIRGIGTADNGGFEQSVGLFIDGVHQPRDRMYRATSFLDVGNVQVLRGPQGYLFGKNTTGGALMLQSAKPTQELEAGLTATYTFDDGSTNGGYNAEGYLSGPLSDTFGMRLAVRQLQDKGYFKNILNTGTLDAADEEQLAARLSMEWRPSDSFSALLKLETGRSRIDGEPNRTYNYGTATALQSLGGFSLVQALEEVGASPLVEGSYVQSWDPGTFDDTDSTAVTLTLDWQLGEFNLLSISGYTEYDYTQRRDGDLVSADFFNQDDTEDFDAISQEFRLLSPLGGTVDYVAGIYYQRQDHRSQEVRNINLGQLNNLVIDSFASQFFPAGFGGPLTLAQYRAILNSPTNPLQPVAVAVRSAVAPSGVAIADTATTRNFSQESESIAVYGNFNIHFADKWTAALGANYSHESKDARRSLTIAGAVPVANSLGEYAHALSGSRSVDQLIGSIKLQYSISDDFMLYASASQGFKSGGFDEVGTQGDGPGEYAPTAGPAQFEFDDEELLSYEIGGKGEFLDSRLIANWAAFYLDVTDRQFSRYLPSVGFIVGNSGETNYRGAELDAQFLITKNLRWDLSVSYVKGKIVEPIIAGSLAVETVGDLSGPNWSATNHLGYTIDLGTLTFVADMYNIFNDSTEFTSARMKRDSAVRTNLRLGLGSSDGMWQVALIANNITDKELVIFPQTNAVFPDSAAGTNTAAAGFMFPPRSYALQFSMRY